MFIAGLVFIGLSVTPARKYIINSIPRSMKLGVGAGIGLFLAIIGLKNAGVVVDNPATLVGLGDVSVGRVISRFWFCSPLQINVESRSNNYWYFSNKYYCMGFWHS